MTAFLYLRTMLSMYIRDECGDASRGQGAARCDSHGSQCQLLDAYYGQGCGLLFTPVQVCVSEFGSDLPGPVFVDPPFVLLLLPTRSPGIVQVEFGPAAVYVPPAA